MDIPVIGDGSCQIVEDGYSQIVGDSYTQIVGDGYTCQIVGDGYSQKKSYADLLDHIIQISLKEGEYVQIPVHILAHAACHCHSWRVGQRILDDERFSFTGVSNLENFVNVIDHLRASCMAHPLL